MGESSYATRNINSNVTPDYNMSATFKNFLLTEAPRSADQAHIYRPVTVNDEMLIAWCEEHAPTFLSNISRHPIWRGMGERVEGLIDTNNFNRKSANTFNHYTIWMDNHSSWEAYPKRSKSLICSTDSDYARGFGSVKLIIPADKNKIGVCSDSDLWESFPNLSALLHTTSTPFEMQLDDVIDLLHHIVASLHGSDIAIKIQEDFGALSAVLKKITPDALRYMPTHTTGSNWIGTEAGKLANAIDSANMKSLYELFEEGFHPNKNSFKLITADQSNKLLSNNEVWTQGACAVIDLESLSNRKEMIDFRKKYNIPRR